MSYTWAGKRLGAAPNIVDDQCHVLMVKHSYGKLNWEVPGRAVEVDESVCEATTREVREGAGLHVRAEHLTGIYHMAENDSHHFVFLCKPVNLNQEPKPDLSEITECGYFQPDALPRPMSDFTEGRIRDALAGEALPLPIPVGPRQWLE